uniref:N-acylneuraminate-9-phosphatase n=1 Tax=Scolopendra viridis TaxID=118503 RepID=A0A4D5R9V3_SCOVI
MEADYCMEKLQSIRAILFDLDNTLIETRGADKKAVEKIRQYLYDHGVPEECARELVGEYLKCFRANPQDPIPGRTDLDSWRKLLWAYALGPDWDYLLDKVYPLWKKTRFENLLFSDQVRSMLKSLRKRYKLALITNGPSEAQWEKMQKLNARDYFDIILVSGDYPFEKPDPAIYQVVFETLGVSADECIMVGDTLGTDIQGGVNAGVAANIWVPLQDCEHPKPQPDYKLDNVCNLPKLLAGNLANNFSSSVKKPEYKRRDSVRCIASS